MAGTGRKLCVEVITERSGYLWCKGFPWSVLESVPAGVSPAVELRNKGSLDVRHVNDERQCL